MRLYNIYRTVQVTTANVDDMTILFCACVVSGMRELAMMRVTFDKSVNVFFLLLFFAMRMFATKMITPFFSSTIIFCVVGGRGAVSAGHCSIHYTDG